MVLSKVPREINYLTDGNLPRNVKPSSLGPTLPEKPLSVSASKVGDIRFCFEVWLPNYLAGLRNLLEEQSNFGN